MTVGDCDILDASIGIAVMDSSQVRLEIMRFDRVARYGVAVYRKKREYGESSAVATSLTIGTCGLARYLVQTGNSLTVDDTRVDVEEVDVGRLYASGVLGD